MKPLKIVSICLLFITALSSCKKEPFWGINGKGSNVTETINYQNFSKIDLGFNATVLYTQDSIYKIEISAQSNIQNIIETEINKGVLTFKAARRIWHHNPIRIVVHSPEMKGFYVGGSGDILAQNPIHTPSMDIHVSGSGSIVMPALNANDVFTDISGSGKIRVEGGASKNHKMDISGSGNIDALSMEAKKSTVDVSGSGNVKVWVTEQLDVTISGSGKVSYKGSPTLNTKISGSGKVTQI